MFQRLVNISKTNSFFLFGARGTGKSTYLKNTLPFANAHLVDLLLDREFSRYERDPDSLISWIKSFSPRDKWVLIDEVQRVPELLNVVHKIIEEEKLNFALTGSSARKLKRAGSNLLAGRAFVYYLFPLTYQEIGDAFDINDVLSFGSLPQLYSLTNIPDKVLFLESYTNTYVKEEIVAEQLVRNIKPFRKFIEVAAQMSGKIINFSSIGRDIGVEPQTVQSYFSILEDTHIGFYLPAFEGSIRKQQRMAPKFYLFDIGVKRALEHGVNLSPISPKTYEYGMAFEQFIVLEMHRLNHYKRLGYSFSYLMTKDDAEIDLIIEKSGKVVAVLEIKSTTNVSIPDVRGLLNFHPSFPKARAILLSLDSRPQKIESVDVLHWRKAFQELGLD